MAISPWLSFCHPTFCVLRPLLQVFLEAESVAAAAELQAFALVFVVAEPSPEVVVLAAESGVVFVAAEPSPEAAVLTAEPEAAVLAAGPVLVSESEVAFVVVESVADAAEPQVSVDIAVAFHVVVPVFVVVVEVDSPGRPTFFAFPSIDYYASLSSSVAVVGKE
jgi:hypothetical protein